MDDYVIMMIVFGVFAALIAVVNFLNYCRTGKRRSEISESLMSQVNKAELGDVASPFYIPKKSVFDD